jgi:hypothetical protein
MHDTKPVGYKGIRKFGELRRESLSNGIVFRRFCTVEPDVLKNERFALAQLSDGLGRAVPYCLGNEANRFSEKLAESRRHWSQAVSRVWCPVGAPKVTQDDDACVCCKKMTNSRNRRPNTTVVCDDSVFERNVKVASNYDARSIEVPKGREGT